MEWEDLILSLNFYDANIGRMVRSWYIFSGKFSVGPEMPPISKRLKIRSTTFRYRRAVNNFFPEYSSSVRIEVLDKIRTSAKVV